MSVIYGYTWWWPVTLSERKVVLLEKVQLFFPGSLSHVVTAVFSAKIWWFHGKILLVGPWLAVSISGGFFINLWKRRITQITKLQLFGTLKYAFWLKKINLPTTIISSFCRKNIAWKWYATHSKQQHFGIVSNNHRVSAVCFGISFWTVQKSWPQRRWIRRFGG